MTLYDRRKKKIIEELKDREYRNAFVEESINIGIPFQIKALREQRKLKQKDFEKLSGMKQALISRLENPDYSGFTLATLKKIASVYDVGLIVRFVPISDLVKWELNLDSESLKALSYKDDPYFKEKKKPASDSEQYVNNPEPAKSTNNVIYLADHIARTTKMVVPKNNINLATGTLT